MALKVETGIIPFWYTPEQEESERMTRFKIKPLTGMENLDISGELANGRYASAQKVALRHGLVGWENLDDPEGKPVEFSLENVQFLDVDLLAKLANVVIDGAVIDKEQTKNSSSQSK